VKHLLVLVALIGVASSAVAQTSIPVAGLVAEGEGRWSDALTVYYQQAGRETDSANLWLRIAEIEATLTRPDRAIFALQRAAAARPGDPHIPAKLSQAYAAAGHAVPALHAIAAALALSPEEDEYLRSAAALATWAGDYRTAADAYGKLRQKHPQEHALVLAFARVKSWSGQSDAAATAYREYLQIQATTAEAWLEIARVESWRGNTGAALAALEEYQLRFREDHAYARERALILARSGRHREALRELAPLLASTPADPELNVARAIALVGGRQHGAAVSTLNNLRTQGGKPDDIHAVGNIVRTMLGTSIGPTATVYDDSDGLRIVRVAPKADIGLHSDTRIYAGYERTELSARVGSGLETVARTSATSVDEVWSGLSQRIGPLTLGGSLGQSRTTDDQLTSYAATVQFATDSLRVAVERRLGFAAFSPRTVSLGLTRLAHRAEIGWTPAARFHLAVAGGYDQLSDANTRWELSVSPRAALARTQRLNLDVGAQFYQFRVATNLDHGYYDPARYEFYSAVLAPYWKVSENLGVSFAAGIGPQRDSSSSSYTLGMNTSVEGTFGIYREWVLKVQGGATNNRRVDSGTFRGASGGVVLLRRF
jgi:tetratricopeptide (TPR) repeat protein